MYKYRINQYLLSLPVKDYHKALKILPKVLNVSSNTFSNYRNIKTDDRQDIPHEKVLMLERLFGLKSGQLENYQVNCKPLSELISEWKD